MKRHLTYYPRYVESHGHWKFKQLRLKLGWAAETKFWALNDMIASSEDCILKLSKKQIRASVMSDLDFTPEEFDEFIDVLTNDCELLVNLAGNVTTETVRECLKLVMKEREAARQRKLKSDNELAEPTKIFKI